MSEQNQRAPVGSQNATLQQDAVTFALIVTAAPGVPVPVDVIDRWARQLGQIDVARALGAAMAANNPLIIGLFDAAGNRMPAGDAEARSVYVQPPVPLDKGAIFNTVIALNTNFFATALIPTHTPATFRVSVSLNAAGVLNLMRTEAAVTVTEHLNENNNLVADCLYEFNVTVRAGQTINLQHSVGGTILSCIVVEVYE